MLYVNKWFKWFKLILLVVPCIYTSPLNPTSCKTVFVLPSLHPPLMITFHLFPSPVHPSGFSFHIISDIFAVYILLLLLLLLFCHKTTTTSNFSWILEVQLNFKKRTTVSQPVIRTMIILPNLFLLGNTKRDSILFQQRRKIVNVITMKLKCLLGKEINKMK